MSDRETLLAIGARLRQARKAAGMTQAEVAGHALVHFTSVSLWELGKNAMTALNVIRVAEALGVTVEWLLLGGEGAAGG